MLLVLLIRETRILETRSLCAMMDNLNFVISNNHKCQNLVFVRLQIFIY